ncbi:MAG: hypothetical protein AMJ79_09640 [Phycisphaerae bacterium SM23_30]|nr:MAG: hypothetical protein AMJ79_09640 [Phycisphaerae bacterium SM23_30]
MTEQEMHDRNLPEKPSWTDPLFLRIFRGFRIAVQPGKMILAILAVLTWFVGGWGVTELEFYINTIYEGESLDWQAERERMQQANEDDLADLITTGLLSMGESVQKRQDETVTRWADSALTKIKGDYQAEFKEALALMKKKYEAQRDYINERYGEIESGSDQAERRARKKAEEQEADAACEGLFNALVEGEADLARLEEWMGQLSIANETEKQLMQKTVQLAQAFKLAQVTAGQGIFETFVNFKLERLHTAVYELVWKRDLVAAKSQIYKLLVGTCWLVRFHPIYSAGLIIFGLIIWSIFGGAICRMAALQAARDERIGAWRALQFSGGKFASFFSAPLIPIAIIVMIAAFILLGGLIGAIPYVGEIVAGLLVFFVLFCGFVIALLAVGLTGGFYLMHPTIAVEGSDSFDAISRSFSYIFARPWRTGFYLVVAAVYGAICYLFVRFFVFLLLFTTHLPARIMNIDGSFMVGSRGKLDALWAAPTFNHLRMGFYDIQWQSLHPTEMIGAFCIWIWVTIAAAAVLGFVISYFFSANTIIYYLLRKHVDATDLEDVYLEKDTEDLLRPPTPAEEETPAAATTKKKVKKAAPKTAKKTAKVKKVKRKKPPSA